MIADIIFLCLFVLWVLAMVELAKMFLGRK